MTKIPAPKGFTSRPTTDFAKESLFNIIENLFDLDTVDVLDLFSGTGSISYEFASRGAKSIVSVELNTKHQAYIKSVIETCGMNEIFSIKADAFKYAEKCNRTFDIIFADPPFDLTQFTEIPDFILNNNLLTKRGLFILEHPAKINFDEHPNLYLHKSYGKVQFSFFELKD